ncbi:MAG: glycosyltransferase [Anaerolineae bacterium]|nr:glycosyltransferase [Anaerolineae bacterium]
MRILFVTPYVPSLVRVRPYNLVHALVKAGHTVTLMCLQPPGDGAETLDRLREWCDGVYVIPHSRARTLMNGMEALPSRYPVQAAYSRSPYFLNAAREVLAKKSYDVVHIEHLRGAVLAEAFQSLPIVFDTVDSITLLFEKVLHDAPSLKSQMMARLDLERTRHFESTLTERFQQVAVTSAIDRQALVDMGNDPERVTVVANGVDLDYFKPQNQPRSPRTLVFTGKMSYHANIAAIEDLVHQIMPIVWEAEPDVNLQIVGKDPSPVIQELGQKPKISVTGYVPDLRPYLAQAAIAVSTVRYGVGIQNKVLEAMAMATPVVCSTQACSALEIENGRDLLVGDNPQAIAQHIIDLIRSREKRAQLGANGRKYVETNQTWDTAAVLLEELYGKAINHGHTHTGYQASK